MFCAVSVYWFHVYFYVRIILHHLVFRYDTRMFLARLTVLTLKVRIKVFFTITVLIQIKHE